MYGSHEPQYIISNPSSNQRLTQMPINQTRHHQDELYEDQCDFAFSDLNNQRTAELEPYDPKYQHLVIVPGLNIKAHCYNSQCTTNSCESRQTWLRIGMGKYNIAIVRHQGECHSCGRKIDPQSIKTMGFCKSSVKVSGFRLNGNSGSQFVKTYRESQGKLIYFNDIDSNMSMWAHLQIQAMPLL